MKFVALYFVTAIIFLAIDVVGLRGLIRPVFERHVGHLLADPFRLGPAAVFYLGYIGGVLWFVSVPALAAGAPLNALAGGVVLGLLAYGTYEFTNYATLSDWTMQQVVIDTLWGGFLTGLSAYVGVVATRAIFPS